MTLEEAKIIIRQNPSLSYDEIQNQASQMRIDPKLVRQAWDELDKGPRSAKKPNDLLRGSVYSVTLLLVGMLLLIIDIHAGTGSAIGTAGVFCVSAFGLYFITWMLGAGGSIGKAIGVSVMFTIMNVFLAMGGMGLFFMLPFALIATFYIFFHAYNIGVFKSILVIVLQAVFIVAVGFAATVIYSFF